MLSLPRCPEDGGSACVVRARTQLLLEEKLVETEAGSVEGERSLHLLALTKLVSHQERDGAGVVGHQKRDGAGDSITRIIR